MSNEWTAPGQKQTSEPQVSLPPHQGSEGHGGFPPGPPPPHSFVPAIQFRPGIIALRPQSLGDLYGAIIKAVRGNLAATMGLALLTSLVFLVPSTALAAWIGAQDSPFDSVTDVGGTPVFQGSMTGSLASLLPDGAGILSTILLSGFLAYVVGQAVLGRKVTASETWEGGKRSLLKLVGGALLTGVIVLGIIALLLAVPIGLLIASDGGSGSFGAVLLLILAGFAGVVLALYLTTRLAFLNPAIVLEKLSIGGALKRSWALTRTGFWRLFGIRILTSIIVGTLSAILTTPLSLLGFTGVLFSNGLPNFFAWQAVITGVAMLISSAITTPFTAGVDALLYVDAQIRTEGLDVRLIQVAQGQAPSPWPRAQA